jgi:hypothetical protein
MPHQYADFFLAYQILFFKECTRSLLCGPSDDQPTNQPTNHPNDKPTNPPTNRLTSRVTSHNSICPRWQNPPPNPPTACYPHPSTVPPVPLSILCCLAPDGSLDLQNIMIILHCSLQERDGKCLLAADASARQQWSVWWWRRQLGVSAASAVAAQSTIN